MTKRPAANAGAGTAAPASDTTEPSTDSTVHARAQAPAASHPRDEFTGLGGSYMRDPVSGVRTRVPPEAPAEGEDTAAA